MKALVLKRYGGPDQLVFADVPRPVPKADEILVQVYAAGLNPIDNVIPKGSFKPVLKFKLPATMGSDLAGVVVEVGARVKRFKPGDEVFASIFDLGTGYGTSRRGAKAGERSFEMLPLDVTSDESVEALVNEVIRSSGRIDVLVNNAGFGVAPAGAEESSVEQAQSIFDANFFGIVRMTRAVLPHMRQQGGGRIINIGSVMGFLPAPYAALYVATKHAIEGYSESLDHELRTRGIRVSVIEPAYTKTQFDANQLQADSKLDEYLEARVFLAKKVSELIAAGDEPSVVAEVVLTAASATRPKVRYTAGALASRLKLLRRFAPAGLVDAGVRKSLQLEALTASPPRTPLLAK